MSANSDVTRVPPLANGQRPETGAMKFGDDWTGVFIRGDNALVAADMLRQVIELIPDAAEIDNKERAVMTLFLKGFMTGFRDLMLSCSEGDTGWPPVRK